MEILVCIKQVADDSVEIFMNEKTGKPALEGVEKVVNAFDTYALEMAVRLKEAKG
ncbi:MAG: electron transfer flavoprotein subunit beta, partial [Fusobacterium periodonticum]|nr:electron transfer flavoprotein subunit beta [Fusobacterium periodonticum]